jgi:hypothetical protein
MCTALLKKATEVCSVGIIESSDQKSFIVPTDAPNNINNI